MGPVSDGKADNVKTARSYKFQPKKSYSLVCWIGGSVPDSVGRLLIRSVSWNASALERRMERRYGDLRYFFEGHSEALECARSSRTWGEAGSLAYE